MLEEYSALINKWASTYGVPVSWVKAVIMTESSGNPDAYRAEPAIGDASYGLMQLLYRTAKGLGYTGDPSGLYDPDTNIQLGTKLIGQIRQNVGDDYVRMYSAYNSGNPDKYLTSSTVQQHVNNAVKWLEEAITEEPMIASTGAISAVLVVMLLVYWKRGRK